MPIAMWKETICHGEAISIRGKMHAIDSQWWHMRGVITGVSFRTPRLDLQVEHDQEVTFFSAWAKEVSGSGWELSFTEQTQVLACHGSNPMAIIDLCCGLGGMSQGAREIGVPTLAAMDISQIACEAFARNHHCDVIYGNIMDPFDVARVFAKAGCVQAGITCGFPCPPFSTRGDALGFNDQRAEIFFHTLNAAYLMGFQFLILECTPMAGKYALLRNTLEEFAEATGMKIYENTLRLQDVWPCFRTRWWCILLPAEVHRESLSLPGLPSCPQFAKVSDVLPLWPVWSDVEDAALTWTPAECQLYLSLASPMDFVLRGVDRCPTLLHSMGHHTLPCPCGCRASGLSKARLVKDGLSLVALPSPTSLDGFRHLHPAEAGYLVTLPPDFQFCLSDIRRDLPLVGNIAAPVQMQWVLTFGLKALQEAGLASFPFDLGNPDRLLLQTLERNIQHRQQLWTSIRTCHAQTITLLHEGTTYEVRISPNTTVAQLMQAQRQLFGWGSRVSVLLDGIPQSPLALLAVGTYEIVSSQPRQLAAVPTGPIMIHVDHVGLPFQCTLPAGVTLATVLQPLGITYRAGLSLQTPLRTYYWGDQIWESTHGQLRGAGFALDSQSGLHATELYNELHDLMRLLPEWQRSDVWLMDFFLMQDILRRPRNLGLLLLERSRPSTVPRWVVVPLLVRQHWALLIFDLRTGIPTYFDGISEFMLSEVLDFLWLLQTAFHRVPSTLRHEVPLEQTDGHHCGTLVCHNFGLYFGLFSVMGSEDLLKWHQTIRSTENFRGSGASDYATAHEWLIRFLVTKGVDESNVANRAALALKKLGTAPIVRAINQPNPWQALKLLGNQQSKPFLWVEHGELQKHIARTAKQNFGASASHKKSKGKGKGPKKVEPVVPIQPELLTLVPKSFTDQSGVELAQISLEQVSPEARGLVITSLQQATRFLSDQRRVSVDALALLTTTEVPQALHGALTVQHLVWPGLLEADPILIRGSCIQLGDVAVKMVLGKTPAPSGLDPDLLKVMVYRDQWPLDWTGFISGPLKALIHRFDALKYCDGIVCGGAPQCGKFHPAVEEEVELSILDAFQWRWTDMQGAQTSSTKSQVFSVLIRVPPSATSQILQLSATDGLYTELRAVNTSGTHPKYAVVWVKGDLQQAVHLKCQSTKALHIVRFFSKYGLRCLAGDHEAMHKQFHPKDPFVACGRSFLFEVGPWPFGISKQAMIDVLVGEGWKARPIRPGKGTQHGRFWLLGSDDNPPSPVIRVGEHALTITKIQEAIAPKEKTNIVASLRTLHKLQHHTQEDPLQISDPWAAFSKQAASSTTVIPSRFSELETQLKSSVFEQVQEQVSSSVQQQVEERLKDYKDYGQAPMEIADPRLDRLEQNVDELRAQSAHFQQWFTEAGEKMGDLFNQIQRQDASIINLNEQVSVAAATAESVQKQVGQLRNDVRVDLEASMSKQTERLEALFSKRSRTE